MNEILTTEQAETLHAARTVLRSLDSTIIAAISRAPSAHAGSELGGFREAVQSAEQAIFQVFNVAHSYLDDPVATAFTQWHAVEAAR